MPIVVSTPVSERVARVVNDICSLQHDNSAAARARATRWVAHVLQDANSRRKWWFTERAVTTMLAGGEDVVEVKGHIDKPVAAFAGARLEKTSLAYLTELRQAAAADGRPNAGRPKKYAVESTPTGLRIHLWPAPGASSTKTFTADSATDQLAVASNTQLTTGLRARLTTTGTLPTPLAANTTYYVIRVSDVAVKLAASLANAKAGTAIDLTSVGSGVHTLLHGLTPFGLLYTRPMDLALVPDFWETIVLNGVLGTFGRHFDRSQLASDPEEFERRYERQLGRGNTDTWDIERIHRWEEELTTELQTALSESDGATAYTVPASLTGIGYVTIEAGDYPLLVT